MRSLRCGGSTRRIVSPSSPCEVYRVRSHVVHIKKKPLYRRWSNSAIMQSTMCGFGVIMYTASMSRMGCRRSSMRSMSVGRLGKGYVEAQRRSRTRDVEVENVIFLDHVVDQLLAVLVHNEYLPLRVVSDAWAASRQGLRTSPRVVWRMALSMTVAPCVSRRRLGAQYTVASYALSECLSSRPCWRGLAANAATRRRGRAGLVYRRKVA